MEEKLEKVLFTERERQIMQSWLRFAIKQDIKAMDINNKKSWLEANEWDKALNDELENSEALELGLFMRRYCWLNVKSREDIEYLKDKEDIDLIVKVFNMQNPAITEIEKEHILQKAKHYLEFLLEYEKDDVKEITETEEFIRDFNTLEDKDLVEFTYNLHYVFSDWMDCLMRAEGMDEMEIKVIRKVCDYVRYKL